MPHAGFNAFANSAPSIAPRADGPLGAREQTLHRSPDRAPWTGLIGRRVSGIALAGIPGLEPELTEPETVGLPITPYPMVPEGSGSNRSSGAPYRYHHAVRPYAQSKHFFRDIRGCVGRVDRRRTDVRDADVDMAAPSDLCHLPPRASGRRRGAACRGSDGSPVAGSDRGTPPL